MSSKYELRRNYFHHYEEISADYHSPSQKLNWNIENTSRLLVIVTYNAY